ncbi:hypothetical protein BCV73_24810 [Paenibacillus sp. SSG-1]|nr:hypothetical protein BCV73_24810 [Paenibacillus sp. SSG-1]
MCKNDNFRSKLIYFPRNIEKIPRHPPEAGRADKTVKSLHKAHFLLDNGRRLCGNTEIYHFLYKLND